MNAAALRANAERRRQLLARSAALRSTLSMEAADLLAGPLHAAGQAQGVLHWLHGRWPLLAGAAAALAVARPRRVLAWTSAAWGLWRLWRRGRGALRWIARMLAKPPARS